MGFVEIATRICGNVIAAMIKTNASVLSLVGYLKMQIQGQFLVIGSVSLVTIVFINVILKHALLAADI